MKTFSKIFILIVSFILIFQSLFIVLKTYEAVDSYKRALRPTAKATIGVVTLCINGQPAINISDCSTNATQNVYYECWLNTTDSTNNNFTYSLEFTLINRTYGSSNNTLFNVGPNDGEISFTPDNDDVGNYVVIFTVDDNIGCDNSEDSESFSLTVINVNDPPVLIENIPDQTISEGGVLHAFYLDNYFEDPDLDNLTYNVSGNNQFIVSINNVTSEVVISSVVCDITEYVMFTAMDPYNETNTSNLVTLRCEVETAQQPSGGSGGTSGGGGGGASVLCRTPEYECYDYHKCNISNLRVQKCVDIHGCENEIFLTVPCKYKVGVDCNETWECSGWGPCLPNGTQSRTCEDLNECGTVDERPLLVQECEYIGTCEDGIKNCHNGSCEEQIDCGGPCALCKSIEVPYPFEEEKGIFIYIITGIVLLLLTAILLYHYFRKEINAALAKAGWVLAGKKNKQILLSIEDKKRLLASIADLEKKMNRIELVDILNKYANLFKYYLIAVCGEGLAPEFDLEDLKKVLDKKKKKIREILKNIFTSSFSKYLKVEHDKALITKRNLMLLIEELRNLVLQTSQVEPGDIAREVKEIEIPKKVSASNKMIINITNAYIALEYLELEVAKEKYLDLLAEYEKLNLAEQEAVFEDTSRLYHNISYVNSWYM